MSETTPSSPPRESYAEPEGVKDTIEAIVVALILAFVFRAFIVEAFVIPTGSMAPTLYGAHGTVTCEDCGTEFAYGLRDLDDSRKRIPTTSNAHAICPNCNHANTNLKINDTNHLAEKGDRILVLKWPFDFGGPKLDPHRWDVVVFKDPSDGVTNFIKRLVGLPNEALMILDGDVYAVPSDELTDVTRAELKRYRHEKYEYRVGSKIGRMKPMSRVVLNELETKVTIRRKAPAAQKALWTTVYNHDYPPHTLDNNQPRWSRRKGGKTGWSDLDQRRLHFDDVQREGDFIYLNRKTIRASNAYNIRDGYRPPPVHDMRVRFVWTPRDVSASIMLRLAKYSKTFWASLRADGHIVLYDSPTLPGNVATIMAEKTLAPFEPGEPVMIAFANVDYRLSLTVRGREELSSSDDPNDPGYYGPSVPFLRKQTAGRWRQNPPEAVTPRLFGMGGAFDVTHLIVDRDIYYYRNARVAGLPAAPWGPTEGWASEVTPILLREDEFFMLGDNTAASKDSRLWDVVGPHLTGRGEDYQLGTVPRDQLIGQAFFVYWPSGHRLDWLPIPKLSRIGVIPDVGRMRWIR